MLNVRVCPASESVAVTVPTTVPPGLFSARLNVAGVTTGASLTSVRVTVTVALPDRGGVPLSVAWTVRLKTGVVSKSRAAALATESWPLPGLIAKAPPVLPAVIAKVWVCPASGSATATGMPTRVPSALCSATPKAAGLTTGGSLTSVRVTVMTALPAWGGVPLSVTCTSRLKTGVASKFSAALEATVSWPEAGSSANAPPTLPAMRLKMWVSPEARVDEGHRPHGGPDGAVLGHAEGGRDHDRGPTRHRGRHAHAAQEGQVVRHERQHLAAGRAVEDPHVRHAPRPGAGEHLRPPVAVQVPRRHVHAARGRGGEREDGPQPHPRRPVDHRHVREGLVPRSQVRPGAGRRARHDVGPRVAVHVPGRHAHPAR